MLTRMGDSSEHRPRVPVSAEGRSDGIGDVRADGPSADSGVLAGLPRTRPQRASARRVAARASRSARPSADTTSAGARATTRAPARSAASTRNASTRHPSTGKTRAKKRTPTKHHTPAREQVPTQGYEAEPESLNGPVHPPGGTELVASAAELAGELAKTGVNTGVRVLRDFLSRLPG
jgi:hypothetical protein